MECTYRDLHSVAYYTPRLYAIAHCSKATKPVQYVTILYTVGSCNMMVFVYLSISKHRKATVKVKYKR